MSAHRTESPASRLWRLFAGVHELATGREVQVGEALNYFGDPTLPASVVQQSGILDDLAKRQSFETLLSEGRHGF